MLPRYLRSKTKRIVINNLIDIVTAAPMIRSVPFRLVSSANAPWRGVGVGVGVVEPLEKRAVPVSPNPLRTRRSSPAGAAAAGIRKSKW